MPTDRRPDGAVFALVGDCVAAAIGTAARERGVAYIGGPVSTGAGMERDFFDLDGTAFVPRFGDVVPQRYAELFRPEPERYVDLFRCGLPLLSTVGSNVNRLARTLHQDFYRPRRLDQHALSDAVLRQVICENRTGPLRFYRTALELGCEVHAVHSAQRFPAAIAVLARRLESIFLDLLLDAGVALVDVRPETTDEAGYLRPEYFSDHADDKTHANDAWGGVVLDRFLQTTGLSGATGDTRSA
jgi:hypothetical protein